MSSRQLDPEVVAALLDGRLPPSEREGVLRIIAESPDDYQSFADALRLLEEVSAPTAEERVGPADIAPGRSPAVRRRRWLVGVPLLAAASIAGLILVSQPKPGAALHELVLPPTTASGSGVIVAKFGTGWDQPGWSVVRGPGTTLSVAARAFRLGAREADIQLALKVGDDEALRLVGGELLELVSGVEAGAPVAALYRGLIESPTAAGIGNPEPAEVTGALDELLGKWPWFKLGGWTELARLAAMARNAEYFSSDGPAAIAFGDVAAEVRGLIAVPPELLSALNSLDRELQAGVTASRLSVVSAHLIEIIAIAGNGSLPAGR